VTTSAGLPFVDEHTREVAATPEQTWAALEDYVAAMTSAPHAVLGPLLGTHPRSGFAVAGSDPPREIVLGGRHRFSTYRLVFRVAPTDAGSRLSALTYAAFPGLQGWLYRTGLLVTTGHARATRGMLRSIGRRAEG
jgi:hypothetical protein